MQKYVALFNFKMRSVYIGDYPVYSYFVFEAVSDEAAKKMKDNELISRAKDIVNIKGGHSPVIAGISRYLPLE